MPAQPSNQATEPDDFVQVQVSTRPRYGDDVRKFEIAFPCARVDRTVEFRWTERSTVGDAAEQDMALLRLDCSHLGAPGCPVSNGTTQLAGWKDCPRVKKLTIRLGSALRHVSEASPPPTAG